MAVVLLTFKISLSRWTALFGLAALLFSKSFIDYSTSGLENPLSHVLIAAFALLYFSSETNSKKLLGLILLASLGVLARLDTALFFIPPLIQALWKNPQPKKWRIFFLGIIPLVGWEIFSIFYYGFPFPNVAYAKLQAGISQLEIVRQGFYYFLQSLESDPITLWVITLGILLGVLSKDRKRVCFGAGMLLYLFYIINVGGDFMSGRFFSILIFCAVILVARIPKIAWKTMIPAFLAVVLIGVFSPYPPIKSGRGYSNLDIDKNGIDDERGYYYQETGLLAAERNTALPRHKWAKIGFRAGQKGQEVMVYSAVGFFGFFAGPRVHIVDPLALCDPLLARLPAIRDPQWRIGHFERYLPKGYVATLQTGIDSFHDRNLSIYYKKLSLIIRGKLFDWNRIKEIINMNLGKYNDLIRFDYYRHPTRKSIKLSQLKGAFPETSPFRDDNAIEFTESGLRIKLNRAYLADKIEISLENDDDYQLEYYGNFKKISSQKITAMYYQPCGLSIYKLDVPKDAAKKGFDTIMILPLRGDGKYLLGNIRFRSRRAISSF